MNGYLKMAKDVGSPIRFEGGALKLDATPGLGVKLLPEEIKELAVA